MRISPSLLLLCSAGLLLAACDTDDPKPNGVAISTQAVFVVNEGQFLAGNAAITRFNKVSKTVDRDLFNSVNGTALGDIAQSMTVYNSRGYIVVNNSNRLTVVGLPSFAQQAQIDGLAQPRYFAGYKQTGFVTEWLTDITQPGRVSVIDLQTLKRDSTRSVAVGKGPEEMLVVDNSLLVANSLGNTISVINPDDVTLASTINVPDGPTNIRRGAGNRTVWVLCAGKQVYNASFQVDTLRSTPGTLVRFSLDNPTDQTRFVFPDRLHQPYNLQLSPNQQTVYYTYRNAVFAMPVTDARLPAAPLLKRNFYGLGVDPADGTLYGTDAGAFSADGKVVRFKPTGVLVDSFSTAVAPGRVVFY